MGTGIVMLVNRIEDRDQPTNTMVFVRFFASRATEHSEQRNPYSWGLKGPWHGWLAKEVGLILLLLLLVKL